MAKTKVNKNIVIRFCGEKTAEINQFLWHLGSSAFVLFKFMAAEAYQAGLDWIGLANKTGRFNDSHPN